MSLEEAVKKIALVALLDFIVIELVWTKQLEYVQNDTYVKDVHPLQLQKTQLLDTYALSDFIVNLEQLMVSKARYF